MAEGCGRTRDCVRGWNRCLALAGRRVGRRALAPSPRNGVNPFRCTIQDSGQGTMVPDPSAGPYCERFDKSNQNVTDLRLIDFLTKEPARFGAAAPKCFYYQDDHWRGSLVQSDARTVLYEFYGHYFFNKATGDGGAWVTGFTIAGQTFDPRSLPGFPPQYDQYFGPGRGFITHDDVPTDPSCVAESSQTPGSIYASPRPRCIPAHGQINRTHVGPVKLGTAIDRVRSRLGPPRSVRREFLRYCLGAGGNLLVGWRGHGGPSGSSANGRAVIVIATSRGFMLHAPTGRAIRVGSSTKRLRQAFSGARSVLRIGQMTVFSVTPMGASANGLGTILAGIVHGRVSYLGTYEPRVIPTTRALALYLARAGE